MRKIIIIINILILSLYLYSVDYTWTGAGDGVNWNNEANWDDGNGYTVGDGYPDDPSDTATIGFSTVSLNENNLTIGNLVLNGTLNCGTNNFTIANLSGTGTFNSGTGTITINGNVGVATFNGDSATIVVVGDVNNIDFSASSGTTTIGGNLSVSGVFSHNNGTIVFNNNGDINQAITFYNLTISAGTRNSLANIIVSNNMVVDSIFNLNNNTISVSGNLSGTGTFNSGNQNITINGNVTVSIISLPINANANIGGTFNPGSFSHNNGTIVMSGLNTPVDIRSGNYYNITINKSSPLDMVRDIGLINIANNLNITQGILNLNGNNINIDNSITIGASGELRSIWGEQINVGANWSNSGTFTSSTSTVIFDTVSATTIAGNTNFYNFTCTTSGKVINFTAGTTQTISNNITITGSSGNLITLQSSTSGNQWFILDNGTENISFVRVSDGNATNSITAATSKNNGNNVNWIFSTSTLTWNGVTDTDWNVSTNWDLGYVPNNTDNVIIADVANDPVLTLNVTVNNLTINVNGILDTNGFNFTVSGTFSNNGRLRTNGVETLTLIMDTDSGEIEYKGGAGGNISFTNFYTLIINGTGSFILSGDTTINGDLTISSGTLDGTSITISVRGNWTNTVGNAGFTETNSTVIFDGTTTPVNVSAETFNNVEIDKTGTVNATGIWNVGGNISLTNGTFNPGNFTHNITGNWTETNITFTPATGTINFNGGANITQKGGNNFYNLTISGNVTLLTNTTMTGGLTVGAGVTLTLNNFSFTKTGGAGAGSISGIISSNNGSFSYGGNITINATGSINFTGSGNLTISGTTTNNGTITGGTGTMTFTGNYTVANNGVLNGGTGLITFSGAYTSNNSGALNIGGVTSGSNAVIFNNNATFNATSTFNGSPTTDPVVVVRRNLTFATTITYNQSDDIVSFESGNASNVNSGGKNFHNIVINKNAGGVNVTLTANLTQNPGYTLTLTRGTLNLNNFQWSIGADFTLSSALGATLSIGSGTFNGAGYNITQLNGTINQGTGTLSCVNFTKSGGTYSISGNGIINISNNFNMTGGTLSITATPTFNITNNFSISGGTFTANSSNINVTNDFILSGVYTFNANTSNINVSGNISIGGGTFSCGTSSFTMSGVVDKTITSNQNIYNLTINTTATKSLGSNITQSAGGVLTMTNGTLNLAGFQFNLGANFTQSAGTLIIGSGIFNGTGYNITLNTGGTITQSTGTVNCNNFSVNGSGTYTITGVATINSTGNVSISSSNWSAGSSTINMSGGANSINSSESLNNLNITGTITINTNNLDINGNLIINSGTLNANTQDIYVAGNFEILGTGVFNSSTRKVIFDGSVLQTFRPRISSFYDIEVNKSGGTVTLTGTDLTLIRDFVITAGTFDTGTQNITITRDFLINGGSFTPNNQIITFSGGVDSNFKPNNSNLWNIVINKSAANLKVTQTDNLNSCNNFTITQGIYDINGNNFTVSGTFSNNGTLELNGSETTISVTNDTDSGLVRYKGAGAGSLKVGNIYYNIEFNNGAGTWSLGADLTVNNNLTITSGTLSANLNQINIGGTWTDTGTFSSNIDQIVRIFDYFGSTPIINTEINFKRLIIDAAGKNITIQGNVTCNYFVLYRGTFIFSGTRTLTVNGDFIALGNNGYIADTLTLDGWAGPVRILDPFIYSGSINFGATGSTIVVTDDFYVNGCNLLATANWNLNIPDNDDDVRKARAYGTINVQRSQSNHWVCATDGPIDGGGNTNWDFNRPTISVGETRFDSVIYISFNDNIENSNNDFNTAITNGWIRYNNDTDTFSGAYTDEACTIPLPAGDFNECYLKISDTANRTWNTDATGLSSGVGTDRNGNSRNIRANITIRSNYVLRDKAKNRINPLPFTYNGTIDRCKPVLIASEIDTETEAPNTFNIVKFTFSEPMLAPGINTTYQNSDGTGNISAGGTGGGLTVAGIFSGFGNSTNSGTVITHSNTMNTVKATDANKRIFIIRLGGNTTDGGCIYSNSPPIFTQISGDFQPNANLRDANNNLIDTTVTKTINVINNWELTPPTFVQIETDERAGQINGFIDNLIIDFDRSVQVYDNEISFGGSTVIWGATTYIVSNVNHSQNNMTNNFNLNLNENTTNLYGDTHSTPTITYINDSNFKFIANTGRVEMMNNHNIVAIDNCNPVITNVSFGIDDPSLSFKSAPYYDTITGDVQDPGAPPYNFNMHSGTGGTTLSPLQKTYHNYIMFKFSEPIANLNGVISDSSSDGYTFNNTQRSTNTFGDFTTSLGNVSVEGFGVFQGDIEVESQSNFILFDDSQTVFIHVAGFYDILTSKFVGHITNSGSISVPNSSGTHYFTTIANVNITDSLGLSLISRDTGGVNFNKIQIDYIKDWDIIQPVFRYIPATVLYKGDPYSSGPPISTLADGAASGSPLLNRVEFVMSKAIRDLGDGFNMSGAFVFTFEKSGITKPANNLAYSTTINKLGDLINQYIGTSLIDSDINDQGFSITFDEEAGMTDDARIKWIYNQVPGKIITDLRGLRLQPVTTERYTLENKPPYIKETRAVVGSNKMYVEFNENVYHNPGMADILVSDFTYTNVFSSGITITNITPIDRRRYILTLSQRIYQNHIAEDLIRANSNQIQDSLNNIILTNIDNPVSYIGINFFEDIIMEDYVHRGEEWRVTKFDGTERITIQNMRIIAKIKVNKFSGFRPILYYDVIEGEESKFWYPSKNKEARMVLGISKGNDVWEFNIPSNDSELQPGKELSFVFKIGTLYCYRSLKGVNESGFSPYDAESYRIKIAELKEQNNKVSIYNNVINPNNNEDTRLVYYLEKSGPVSIVVYDLSGNIVKVLVGQTESAGKHIISWNGVNENGKIVTRGVYFIRVRAPGIFNQIRKVLVVK